MTREPAPHQRGERLRRLVRERDWEFAFKRFALLLVIVPSALLISAATAEADSGGRWWPWLLAGAIWLLLAGFTSALLPDDAQIPCDTGIAVDRVVRPQSALGINAR